jgi:DNA polymerase II large subunit
MITLNSILGVGTQLKMERPGKGTTVTPCTNIDGPIVKTKDGSVFRVDTVEAARLHHPQIEEILFLGDILISYGDFFNRAHLLVPVGYCEEWWVQELERGVVNMFGAIDCEKVAEFASLEPELVEHVLKCPQSEKITPGVAFSLSSHFNTPLHPRFTYFWEELSVEQVNGLVEWIATAKREEGKPKLVLALRQPEKRSLELIGMPHMVINREFVVISGDEAETLLLMGLTGKPFPADAKNAIECVSLLSGIKLREKGGMFIGARMGRPEKGKIRKLKGSPHALFPVGTEGGRMRSIHSALEAGKITGEFPIYHCKKCSCETIYPVCETCNTQAEQMLFCKKCAKVLPECKQHPEACVPYREQEFDIRKHFSTLLKKLGMEAYPDLIKGVRGTSNKSHIPEHLAKGILRAKHNITVNKDGTVRFDMTQLPVTHFKPIEIGTPLATLKKLGYTVDVCGNPLENEEQVLELRPQDIILPRCIGAGEEGADKIFVRIAQFIDDLLKHFYHLKPFYNVKTQLDLVGHLALVLAPHTSAGITARIIGFSNTQGLFAHPMLHAATRRDCDGDEACAMLMLDTLINFSREYLPGHRGSTQDAPLVITSRIKPSEIDDMVLDMDIVSRYPLELYEAALEYKTPYEVKVQQVGSRVNTEEPTSGFCYTMETDNLNKAVLVSTYKTIPTMEEKLVNQMGLAKLIRAVDATDVARLVIEKHFIRDVKGNLRKFSMQQFRCVGCNKKFRRPPLIGKCDECGGNLIFTISKGSIVKYLEPAINLAKTFDVSPYLLQSLELTKNRIEDYFGKEKEKQAGLGEWF